MSEFLAPNSPADHSAELMLAAADTFHELARALKTAGRMDLAWHGYEAAAAIDLSFPHVQASWGGPFNGQEGRCRLFTDMLAALSPAAIIETGTFRGTTTEFIANNFSGPILSCEIEERWFIQAAAKLASFSQVKIELKDSRTFLTDTLPTLPQDRPVVFYLDAHWSEDLPLQQEINLILAGCPKAVVMIDDFAVPFDDGYKFDNYGPGKVLCISLLRRLPNLPSYIFFPTLPSAMETGAKRGMVVLAQAELGAILHRLPGLRRFDSISEQNIDPALIDHPQIPLSHSAETSMKDHICNERPLRRIIGRRKELADLKRRIQEIEADRSSKLEIIHRQHTEIAELHQRISEIEADRSAKLELIRQLQAEVGRVPPRPGSL